jgi:hypothetical protein
MTTVPKFFSRASLLLQGICGDSGDAVVTAKNLCLLAFNQKKPPAKPGQTPNHPRHAALAWIHAHGLE